MPYRALIFTLVTVALGLLAVTLYLYAVSPYLAHLSIAPTPTTGPEREMRYLLKGTLLLAFLLVSILLLVGLFATTREWMRRPQLKAKQKPGATPFVDAWKLAGERMETPPEEGKGGRE